MSSNARAILTAQIRHGRGTLALSGILMLVQSGAALAVPWLASELTAALTAGSSPATLSVDIIFLGLIILFSVQALLGFGYGYLLATTEVSLGARLRILVHDHLQSLPLTHHNEKRSGDYLTLLSHDIAVVCNFVTGAMVPAVPMLLTLVFALAMMWHTDWVLAGLAAVSIPFFYLLSRRLNRQMRASAERATEAEVDILATAEEHFRLIPLIKAYGREPITSRRFRDCTRRAMSLGKKQSFLLHRIQPLLEFLSITGLICLLWLGSRMTIDGSLSTAGLVSFFLYGVLFARSMSSMASLYGQIQQTRVAINRLEEVLDTASEARDEGDIEVSHVSGQIEFRNVQFSYPGRGDLLSGLNFEIRAGETVAITGSNGAGKSTLVNLLLRFYSPDQGGIYLDGVEVSRMRLACLREQIGWVPQMVFLFDGTVYENIAFGCRDSSRHAVEAAARAAQADEFIRELPEGYNTVVGREALKLSGGQRQRIALARALLKDAPILILDEATVMFDPRAEAKFLEDNRRYLADRTTIIITHHQESLELADRVLKLEDGQLTDLSIDSFGTALAAAR